MAEEMQLVEGRRGTRKRKFVKKQGPKNTTRMGQKQKRVKIDKKMKKLFHKRARQYNSDDEDEVAVNESEQEPSEDEDKGRSNNISEDEGEEEIQPGITKFTQGCRAFKTAFTSIINKTVSDDSLGPVLSGHKKLIVDKLAEEEAQRKVKGEAKKEKHMIAEKGHVKPVAYLDSREKSLISVATKGVVKLFNAVNKAQTAQKGLDPSRTRDAKEIRKRTKEAFFSELAKTSLPAIGTSAKANASAANIEDEQPTWAPLRDNYMLTSSRLKDWDKMPDKNVSDDDGKMSKDSSSDED